ncbi:MAG: helix-turn-helix domain-containing protein [Chloroflexi bacterium]|nr:helix-turn-helix domain-containing protein [Chloroflexota bacterium]
MAKRVKLRSLTAEEAKEVRRLARSRTETAQVVQRARVIAAMIDDPPLTAAEAGRRAGFQGDGSGIQWVRRFNEAGLAGLHDRPRSGRPRTHDETVRSKVVALATQKPSTLGYPFELWTLERLQTAVAERVGIHLSDSTIWTWLDEEGLPWRQESGFHEAERHDPAFEEKRGR